jgi:hypothetical protein
MALPKAVQQQLEEADRLVGQINGEEPGNPETGTNVKPSDPPQDLSQNQGNPSDDSPPVVDEPVSTETKPNVVPDETWEKKYYVLQGKFDAEVPRLHSDLREMKMQIQQLLADNAMLREAKPAEVPKAESLITDEDKEAFGPDLIDLIERATNSKVAALANREAELVREIKELKGQLGNVTERQVVSEKDRFLNGLAQQVPDWESLNVNPGFLAWLQEVDPVYGIPKQAALSNAYEGGDVARVATIFNSYKSMVAPKAPKAKTGQQELQRQVAPTRTRSGTPPNSSESEQYFSHQDIEQFYTDWRRGVYDDAEAASMEKQIHAAAAEGRIR